VTQPHEARVPTEAVAELQRYLSDAIAPMMAADSVGRLMRHPPALTAEVIAAWMSTQLRGPGAAIPISDYLFHSMKKIQLLGEYKLVNGEKLRAFLDELTPLVLALSPEEDRARLAQNLEHLGVVDTIHSSSLETIYRQTGSEPAASGGAKTAATPAASAEQLGDALRRFSLLLTRLEAAKRGGGPDQGAVAAELLSSAVSASRTIKELEERLETLRGQGLEARTDQLLRTLAGNLPDWDLPDGEASSTTETMKRIVSLSHDPKESAARFRELVAAAVEQVNQGSLARAATMLTLADQILATEPIDKHAASAVKTRAHLAIEPERLKGLAEDVGKRPLFRKVLGFFDAYSPKGLLTQLREEAKRESRRLLLTLLEVHGDSARSLALEALQETLANPEGEEGWYFQRNLLHILRRVARPTESPPEREIEALVRLSDPGQPAPLVKEALADLGQIRHARSEQVLVLRLTQLVGELGKADGKDANEEALQLVDRAAAALARQGTASAGRAIADVALRKGKPPGLALLAHLATIDLSADAELTERLSRLLRGALPLRVLGFVISPSPAASASLNSYVTALSGTTTPSVRRLFEEVATKFADQDYGKAAARALATAEPVKKGETLAPSVTGDLDVFALPTLIQSLEASAATGILTLRDKRGEITGTATLENGRFRGARCGTLVESDAFYQILERPAVGTFHFARRESIEAEPDLAPARDLLPLLIEGMYRHDELRRASALVDDAAVLEATGDAPSSPSIEDDLSLIQRVWTHASAGETARSVEDGCGTDTFRVRRLLAHWVQEGALRIKERV
jgi:hypothetical protein